MSLITTHKRDNSYNSLHKMRTDGWIPGVVYGHNFESVSVQVKETELRKFLSHHESVFEINVDSKKHMASVGELQKDSVTGKYIHVSFHKLNAGEKVHMMIPIHWVGTAAGTKEGGVITHLHDEVDITALPSKMPEHIDVDISHLKIGENLKVKDIHLNSDCEWAETDLEKVVVNCNFAKIIVEEPEETETIEGDAPEATAEGEATTGEDEVKEAS